MKVFLSVICISSLLLASFSLLPQATAQCLTKNDDMSKRPVSTDLSGILDFNLQLFREMIPTDMKRNFIFSSYSIWNALTLAYFGASGQTEEQLRKILHHDDKLSTLQKWRALEYMYTKRPETSVNNTFILANRAYFDTKIQLRSCMEDLLHTEIEKIDFTKPQQAANHINNFVSKITRGTIKQLVTSDDVNGAKLVLANAAYFKGVWEKTFDKQSTKPHTFTGLDETRYIVDMMEQTGKLRYGHDEELKADFLELPYTGQSVSMLFFKPYGNNQSNFNTMIQGLSMKKFEEVIGKMVLVNMKVKIPKFRFDTTCDNELLQALSRMGLTEPTDKSKADFTAFTLEPNISLDKSIHKAYIDVNEEGTEAAAATAIIQTKSGGMPSFECNCPFMFVIRDRETKNLLFMGVYKSSDKIDVSHKPTEGSNGNNFFPEQDKINTNVNINSPIPDPGKKAEIAPTIIRRSQNLNPVIPSQEGTGSNFSLNLNPTPPSPPIRRSSRRPGQIRPSFANNRGFFSGREPNQNKDRGGNSGSISRRGSDPNIDRIIPSSGGNNERIPERGDLNPNLNIPPTGNGRNDRDFNSERGTNQNPEQNIPFINENREDNPRPNRSRPSLEENSRDFRRGRSDQDSSE